jgi:hypothetical protein
MGFVRHSTVGAGFIATGLAIIGVAFGRLLERIVR